MQVSNVISPSALSQLDCRQQWAWSRKYSRIKRVEYFDLGTAIHESLDTYYRYLRIHGDVGPVKAFALMEHRLGEWIEDQRAGTDDIDDLATLNKVRVKAYSMLEGYVKKYPIEPFEVIEVEHTITRPIPGTKELTGIQWFAECRVDGIVKHKRSNTYWGLEHKTFSTFHEDNIYRNHQFIMEHWCGDFYARELGIRLSGTLYNGLRSQIPGPRVTAPLFERVWMSPTRTAVRLMIKRLQDVAELISSGSMTIYPEPNEIRCNMCSFKEPCTAKLREEDSDYMLKTLYKEYIR